MRSTRSLLLSSALVVGVLAVPGAPAALAAPSVTNVQPTVVVDASNPHGWGFRDDQSEVDVTATYVAGPAAPPLGHGSANLVVHGASEGFILTTAAFAGTPLADITTMDYSTLSTTSPQAASMQFGVSFHAGLNDFQGRLVYEPYINGTVVPNTWQRWQGLAGKWWASTSTGKSDGHCLQASPCDWDDIVAEWPDAFVLGIVAFKAGSHWTDPATISTNVDQFTIGIESGANVTEQTFDFEDTPQCTLDCYVDATTGLATNGGTSVTDAKRTIQSAVTALTAGGTVHVAAGTYDEDVVVGKAATILGAGSTTTTVRGPIGGSTSTFSAAAAGVVIDGFTITRVGNTTAQWADPNLNLAGVSVQSQGNTVEVRNSRITGNRNGIDVNNANGSSIHDNVIDHNRTGMILRNQTDGLTVTGNRIVDNFTLGVIFLDASGGTNSPVQSAQGSAFTGNDISGNWYGQIVDRQTGGTLPLPGSAVMMKDVHGNYLGTTDPVVTTGGSNEPGYSLATMPAYFAGGTATAPAPGSQPDVAGAASANIDISPFLYTSIDTDNVAIGFQGNTANIGVTTAGGQIGGGARIPEGVAFVSTGGDVHVDAGSYPTSTAIAIGKSLRLLGPNAGTSPNNAATPTTATTRNPEATIAVAANNSGITVGAAGVTIDGFRFTDAGDAGASQTAIIGAGGNYGGAAPGIAILDNVFDHTSRIAVYFNGSTAMDGATVNDNRVDQPTRANSCVNPNSPVALSSCGYTLFNLWQTDHVVFRRNVAIGNPGNGDRVRVLALVLNTPSLQNDAPATNFTVSDNTVRYSCTYTCFAIGKNVTNAVVQHNEAVLDVGNAVQFQTAFTGGTVSVDHNVFTVASDYAVSVDNPASVMTGVIVTRNSITGGGFRTGAGSTQHLAAPCNWWGNAAGPNAAQNGTDGAPATPASIETSPALTSSNLDTICGAPSSVSGTPGNQQVAVTWTAPPSAGSAITSYTVTAAPSGTTCSTTGALTCTVTGLTNGTPYTFTVVATNAGGPSAPSPASAPITPRTTPGAPLGAGATAGDSSVAVTWAPPISTGGAPITGYLVTAAPGAATCTTTTSLGCTVSGLTNGVSYTFTVAAMNVAGTGSPSSATPSAIPFAVESAGPVLPDYTPVGPKRVFDTRLGFSPDALRTVTKQKVGGATELRVQMTDLAGFVPSAGAGAVSLNVTATNPAAAGYITVYSCGTRDEVSSVNFGAGQTVANAVIATVADSGDVCFYSSVPTDVVVDLNGWFAGSQAFHGVGPKRVFDTRIDRTGTTLRSVTKTKIGAAIELRVQMTDLAGFVPATGVGAVSLNVTVTNATLAGFVTVYACGTREVVSSVNYVPATDVANAVIATPSASGEVCFYSSTAVDVVVDVNGWIAAGQSFNGVGPKRLLDTRAGFSPDSIRTVPKSKIGGPAMLEVTVTSIAGLVPTGGVGAVSLNVTATNGVADGYVTVYACGTREEVSSVNFGTGGTVANAVIAPVSATGTICFFASNATDLVVDVNGWFAAPLA